jgi:hypothetical protein
MKEPARKIVPDDVEQDQQLHRLVHLALERDGSLIPISPQGVAQAEDELDDEDNEVPVSLSTFDKALKRANENRGVKCVPLKITTSMEENLARAARDGGDVAPEVEARMRADRAVAEGNSDAKGQK